MILTAGAAVTSSSALREEKDGRPVHPLKGVPVDKVDGYLKDMLNKCKRIQPEYLPIVEVVDYQEKKFIVVWAPGGYLRPYSSPKSMAKGEKERICYIRKMSSTIIPSEEGLWKGADRQTGASPPARRSAPAGSAGALLLLR